jgi:hypothetical protein
MASLKVRTMGNFCLLEAQFPDDYDTYGEALVPAEEEEPEFDPEVVSSPVAEVKGLTASKFIDIATAAIAKMTVPQLKEELSIWGYHLPAILRSRSYGRGCS